MITADGFINSLLAGGYMKPAVWKRTMPETSSYTVDFDCERCGGRHSFLVRIIGGIHYVDEFAVRNFAVSHKVK